MKQCPLKPRDSTKLVHLSRVGIADPTTIEAFPERKAESKASSPTAVAKRSQIEGEEIFVNRGGIFDIEEEINPRVIKCALVSGVIVKYIDHHGKQSVELKTVTTHIFEAVMDQALKSLLLAGVSSWARS